MASRDFSFLSLRPPLVAYQANGLLVPPNNVLITSSNGAATFSNKVTISTINASTTNSNIISSNIITASSINAISINTSSINANIMNTNSINASSINASTIDAGYFKATQVFIDGPSPSLIVNNTIAIIGSTPAASQLLLHNGNSRLGTNDPYGGLFLQAQSPQSIIFSNIDATTGEYASIGENSSNFNGSMTVASTLTCSTLISNNIITDDIYVRSSINLLNSNANTLELTWNSSTLFIDGHPVATDGTVSTVSSVFWQDNGGFGNIVNKNIGVGNTRYLVGIGTGTNPLNATLDVSYTGTSTIVGNVINLSSFNNRFTVVNSSNGTNNFMTAQLINNQNDIFGTSLRFVKTQNFNSTVSGNELGYIDFHGTNPSLSSVRGAYILAEQSGIASNFTPTNLQFVTCTSSSQNINMVITSGGNVGINTTNPSSNLQINGTFQVQSDGELDPFKSNTTGNYLFVNAGNTGFVNLGAFSTNSGSKPLCLQLESGGAIGGNVGINISSPQFMLDVAGSIHTSVFLSTNTINMTSTGITGNTINFSSTISINSYSNDVNNGVINIGTAFNPTIKLGSENSTKTHIINGNININGSTYISSNFSTNNGIVNQNSGIRLIKGFENNTTRPPLVPTNIISSFVIHGAGQPTTNDDGFLQLSAGGGTNTDTISFIQLSGFSSQTDMNQNIVFGTEGTEKMRILNTGNIGINTQSPIAKLDVNGDIYASSGFITQNTQFLAGPIINTTGYNNSTVLNYFNDTLNNRDTLALAPPGNLPSQIIFKTNSSNSSLAIERMRIVNNGNIGINSSTPQGTLDVTGDIVLTSSNQRFLRFTTQNNDSFIESANTLYFTTIDNTNTAMVVQLNANPRIGINTQSPQDTLDVNGNTIIRSTLSTNSINMTLGKIEGLSTINGVVYPPIAFWSGSLTGDIHNDNTGNVGIGTNTPITTLQVNVPDKSGKTGIAAKSSDVNTIIGAFSANNYGSIQVTDGNNLNPYALTLNPIGGDIYIGNIIGNLIVDSGTTTINSGTTINGNLTVAGSAISRVATAQITSNPGSTYTAWTTFLGKYCFVDGVNITLPTSGLPLDINGTIIVIRNISAITTINVTNSFGNTSILPGKTSSYVFTNSVTTNGWYSL